MKLLVYALLFSECQSARRAIEVQCVCLLVMKLLPFDLAKDKAFYIPQEICEMCDITGIVRVINNNMSLIIIIFHEWTSLCALHCDVPKFDDSWKMSSLFQTTARMSIRSLFIVATAQVVEDGLNDDVRESPLPIVHFSIDI